jgi:predicted GNAT family N-acyltransferase
MLRLYFRAMFRIELMRWERARAQATPIRFAVFVEEQGVPRELEMDEHDRECAHALALDGTQAVGTGRLLPDGHIGRMAVLKEWRGRGIGGLILEKLIEAARARGDREVVLAAQVHAIPFYRRHAFEILGAVYEEAGIPHQDMRRAL